MANMDKMPLYPPGEMFASPWFLKVDDNLRLTSYNALASVRLEVRYRFFDCDGKIQASQEAQAPNTDRTAKSTIFATPEGWLLGGEVFVSGAAPLIGQTYVVLEIVRGLGASALPLQVIAAGYVSAKQPLPFPNAQMFSTLDGGGALRSISGTTPGAAAEVSETVPTGARWLLIGFKATFTTSATVANRLPRLLLDDGANVLWTAPVGSNHAAGLGFGYYWVPGSGNEFLDSITNAYSTIPQGMYLGAGFRLRTLTNAIQAGDQWSAVQYLVREWLEGA